MSLGPLGGCGVTVDNELLCWGSTGIEGPPDLGATD